MISTSVLTATDYILLKSVMNKIRLIVSGCFFVGESFIRVESVVKIDSQPHYKLISMIVC